MSQSLARKSSLEEELIPLKATGSMSSYTKPDTEGESSRGTSFGSEIESGSIRLRPASREQEGSPDEFIDIQGKDPTSIALEQCDTYVLNPYRFMLKFLGWTPFHRDGDNAFWKIARCCVVAFWVLIITTGCLTQILSCFRRDLVASPDQDEENGTSYLQCEQHIISSLILTDFLLYASYLFGLYLFSKGETEYLSNLAERVFIKNASAKKATWTNWFLTFTIGMFFVLGLVWILLSIAVRIITIVATEFFDDDLVVRWSGGVEFSGAGKETLVIMSLIGFVSFDVVYIVAVMNYAAQSEMIIYLLKAIAILVVNKEYPDIDAAIRDIMEAKKYLHVLNGKTATATALILFNLGAAAVVAMVSLNDISEKHIEHEALATVASGMNVVFWGALVSFPFVQAARVTDAADKLKDTGPLLRARPLQYMSTPQLDLDSYITLTQAVRLRATMFSVPIYPWMMYGVLVAFTFVMLVLFQLGTYNFTYYL